LICDRVVGLSGSPLPASTSTFLPDSAVYDSTTVPHSTCAKWVHPLYGFAPLQSTSVPQSTSGPKTGSAFLGVEIPLRDINQAHRYGGLLDPPPFRPRCFAHPRRFDPPLVLRVYFTPQPRPGFTLQGLFPPSQTHCLSATRCPLVVICSPLLAVAHQLHVPQTRPQGFDPRRSPWPTHRGLAVAFARAPLEFSLPQVFPLSHLTAPSRHPPLVTFRKKPSQSFSSQSSACFSEPAWLASPEAADLLEVLDLSRNQLALIR